MEKINICFKKYARFFGLVCLYSKGIRKAEKISIIIRLRELKWKIEAWFIEQTIKREERRNPDFKNCKPPADLYDKVMQRIRESESNHE